MTILLSLSKRALFGYGIVPIVLDKGSVTKMSTMISRNYDAIGELTILKFHVNGSFMSHPLGYNSFFIKSLLVIATFSWALSLVYQNNSYKDNLILTKDILTSSIMNIFGFGKSSNSNEEWRQATSVYDFTVKDIDNQDVKLDKYKGKVLLIVNVASKCGFTKTNYKELNELYSKYGDRGLAILGFPCNQFGHQEPGCDVDIKEFIKKNNVEWDIFAKVDVNGDNAIPLYNWLKSKAAGTLTDAIKWNFTKFLINKDGLPVGRYAPNKSPMEFEKDIETELNK